MYFFVFWTDFFNLFKQKVNYRYDKSRQFQHSARKHSKNCDKPAYFNALEYLRWIIIPAFHLCNFLQSPKYHIRGMMNQPYNQIQHQKYLLNPPLSENPQMLPNPPKPKTKNYSMDRQE